MSPPTLFLVTISALLTACNGSDPKPPVDGGADAPALADAHADSMPDRGAWLPVDPTMEPGAAERVLLVGKIVTPATEIDGQVLVESGLITCVAAGTACSTRAGAAGATVIQTNGVIAPGLIDTHNHILFDIFDDSDWLPSKLYTNHTQWTAEARYAAMVDVKQCLANDSAEPAWCANTPYGTTAGSLRCELDKWGELKGMIAGTTSIVGLPGTSSACFDSLSRSIDSAQNGGLGTDAVQTSALFPPSKSAADGVCANLASGKTTAYLIHCGEGIDKVALGEFQTLGNVTTTPGCLYAPQTAITHGTAFTAAELGTMAQSGMKLTWSPASNIALYGETADIPMALAAGLLIALAPDWSMGGSQNLLDELRFADDWDNKQWGDQLTPRDLLIMATSNAAAVVAFQDKIGQIKEGMVADLFVVSGDPTRPYDAILAATPGQVALVMIGGTVLYGDESIRAAGPAQPGCESIEICGRQKFLCVATTNTADKLGQTYQEIKSALEQGLIVADQQTASDGFDFAPLAPLVRCQ